MIDGIILDIDGTVARGAEPLPGALDVLTTLRERGLRHAFFTNDNQQPVRAWQKKLAAMGIEAQSDEVVTSALVAAEAVAELYAGRRVLVVGGEGLFEAMQAVGVTTLGWDRAAAAEVVVMGKDPAFDQDRLALVCKAIWSGAAFVATNYDPRVPIAEGFAPGTGPMVKAVAYATGVEPLVTGKPSAWAGRMAARRLGISPDRVAVVGDQLATDIAMGRQAGMWTVLVLTGASSRADVEHAAADMRPDAVIDSIADLPAIVDGWSHQQGRGEHANPLVRGM
jgi:4-nitrophenyl phosphatase